MTTKRFVRTALAIAFAGAFTSAPVAYAQSSAFVAPTTPARNVQAWRTESVNPATTRFVISFDNAPASIPLNFRGPDGTYVAIDFPSTAVVGSAKNVNDDASTLVKGMRWAESGGRSRLVLNTLKGTTHTVTIENKDVVITLSTPKVEGAPVENPVVAAAITPAAKAMVAAALPAKTAAAPVKAPSSMPSAFSAPVATPAAASSVKPTPAVPATTGALLRDIDYKKTGVANGVLTLDLSDPNVKVRVYREGSNLVIDLPNTTLPRNLAKRARFEQLDTPVQAISPSSSRDGFTRLLIEARGGWDHAFTQNGSTIAITIIKIGDDYRVGGKKVFTGKKMSLDFQQIEVRKALEILGNFTGLNVVASDSVTGSITLTLNEVPWDHVLDVILSSKNLDMRRSGNVITVAPKEEIVKQEKQDREDRLALEAAEPTITETFQINYHQAEEVKTLLEAGGSSGGATSPGSAAGAGAGEKKLLPVKLRADKRTNQLFATGTPGQLDEIRDVIRSVDIANRQVTIEAKIVEVSDSFAKNVGMKFGFNNTIGRLGGTGLTMGNSINENMGNTGGLGGSAPLAVSLPAAAINGANPGTFAFTLFNSSLTRFLNLEVSALEADGKAKTISSPRVVTADNVEAIIKQGTEIPYQEASASGATSISFKTAAMVLKVTPQITPNGKVSLKLDVNKDSIGQMTASGPSIDTKSVSTKVLVDNGGTIVIGGIFIQDELSTVNKVPLLGDLPMLGNAFRNTEKTTSKKELIIMVTPRVIDSAGSNGPVQ